MRKLADSELDQVNGGLSPLVVGVGIGGLAGGLSAYSTNNTATGVMIGATFGAMAAYSSTLAIAATGFMRLKWVAQSIGLSVISAQGAPQRMEVKEVILNDD